MIFIVDSDTVMAKCMARAISPVGEVRIFSNALEAMAKIAEGELPKMIFLDAMLTGPDGFTFLNELVSYFDTAKIPVVLVSTLDFSKVDFSSYGVVGVLNKETMLPKEILNYAKKYAK